MGISAAKLHGLSRRRYGLLLVLGALLLAIIGGGPVAHADPTPPTVSVIAPAAGSTISGVVSVQADAASSPATVGIDHVAFSYFDGARFHDLGSDGTAPFTTCFDTTTVANTVPLGGTIYATAYDNNGVASIQNGNGVTVQNSEGATEADAIRPCSASLSLGRGSFGSIDPTLHLNASPPKADILFALDTTGSMGAALTDARTDANAIVHDIQQSIPGARFAVADFKDYPVAPFGQPEGNSLGIPADYEWRVRQGFTTNAGTVECTLIDTVQLSPIECALNQTSAPAGSGNDNPEAYNYAFFSAYHDTEELNWATGASRFMVVLGDSLPHDAALNTDFPSCPNTPPTDPGGDRQQNTGDDLHTLAVLTELKKLHTNLSFVTYNPNGIDWNGESPGGLDTFPCQQELAQFTGGNAVIHTSGTAQLEGEIVGLIRQAAASIDTVNLTASLVSAPEGSTMTGANISFDPPLPFGPISAPADIAYHMTVGVPNDTPLGDYVFEIHAIADNSDRATQTVTVHVTNSNVSSLQLTADQSSVPVGIASGAYSSIPAARLGSLTPDVASAPAGSIPAGSIPAGSIPAGSIPAGSIPAGSIPAGSIPAGSIPAGSILLGSSPAGSIPAGSIPAGSIALKSVLLSQIPLVGTTWTAILKDSPFANEPLQAVTLDDIAHYGRPFPTGFVPADGKTPWERLQALPLKSIPLFTTLWRNIPFSALMLGNAPLDSLPVPRHADGTPYASWSAAITDGGGSLTGVNTATNTALGIAISGQLGSTPAGSIPAGSIPAGSIPAGSIPAGSIDINATALRTVLISSLLPRTPLTLADFVNCTGSVGGFTCPTGSTLGQADAAGALNPSLTLDALFAALPAGSIGKDTTIDQIIQAMLPLSDYPWEQIKLQGLQDVIGTGKNVRYHVDFDLNCALATSFTVHVNLPDGFFAVPGSSAVSYGGAAPVAVSDPVNGANGPRWLELPGSPCGTSTLTRHMRLDFSSYVGLNIGRQTSSVDVTTSGKYFAVDQAPVLVTQNWEPSDDPATAPTIQKDTLVVGHIASSNDVDYFRFSLDGLAPGTKVAAYLKTAPGTDLDLALNKPGAPTIQPSPAGSIPAGSIGIEDSNPGVDNSRRALPPDTLADIPAGSIPAGSIPAGSIPAGSISANRGAVNEAVQIVTHGETGSAVIGVSGYNGAFSDGNYVVRVKVTPPPTLPTCPAITNLAPTLAQPSSLPTSLPSSTQAIFLVNRQRLAGMYGLDRMNALLNSPDFTTVRSQVNGQIVPVDGSTAVRNAYAAWDSNPCSPDAANAVVSAINGVVAGYRSTLPNLRYVVLLGTDQALPSWRLTDLTSLSPEIDNAQELVFTTDNLSKGNSTYASSALNTVLSDQAYGNFVKVPFLDHSMPLAQLSVSRVVETPEDIISQFGQYVTTNGRLNVSSALTTGDDFFVDGAQKANEALNSQFGLGTSSSDTLFPPTSLWTKSDLVGHFFGKTGGAPSVGALYAHYNHWLLQPAGLPSLPTLADFPTSGDVTRSQLIFTIGCHSGFSLPDTVGGPIAAGDTQRQRDWAQAYGHSNTAVYLANTGFGYGDTKTVDLSEKLMRNFARDLNTGGTIGEQWVRALHEYYREAGAYDVVDEKVMVEANMYGLPFYGFSNTPQPQPPTAPQLTPTVVGGLNTAHVPALTASITAHDAGDGQSLFYDDSQAEGTTTAGGIKSGTLSVIYRPVQPQLSRDVTVPGTSAHGAFITDLTTHTIANVKPVKPFPLVFDSSERPRFDFPSIFFPAGLVTVNRDVIFGQERSTLVVNMGRFRPDAGSESGTEQVVDSVNVDIGYSNSSDNTPPQITQVGAVKTAPGTFKAFVRVTDDTALNRVSVLYNAGAPQWNVQALTNAGGGLWTATITTATTVDQILLDGEAQDSAGNVGYSFNKAVNFQSVPDTAQPGLLISQPLPNGTFVLNQQVKATFDCSDPGGVQSCSGRSDSGPAIQSGGLLDTSTVGPHTFTVTATDLSGNTVSRSATYKVFFTFGGFLPPVNNPPVLNLDNAGRTIPVKWSLTNAAGQAYAQLNAVQSISSRSVACPSGTPMSDGPDVAIGLSGLKVTGNQFNLNWSTDKSWAGTCRRLFVHFADGTTPYVDFQFK